MPNCIKCGADAGTGSVICRACDDRPKVTNDAATETRPLESMTLRSDTRRFDDQSSATQDRGPDEKKETMMEAILRLDEKEEKKGFIGAVVAILSALFGGFSG